MICLEQKEGSNLEEEVVAIPGQLLLLLFYFYFYFYFLMENCKLPNVPRVECRMISQSRSSLKVKERHSGLKAESVDLGYSYQQPSF